MKAKLTQHKGIHTGAKAYEYNDFGKVFRDLLSLRNCVETHIGGNPLGVFNVERLLEHIH